MSKGTLHQYFSFVSGPTHATGATATGAGSTKSSTVATRAKRRPVGRPRKKKPAELTGTDPKATYSLREYGGIVYNTIASSMDKYSIILL